MLKTTNLSPYNYSEYNFITENSIDIKDNYIYSAEKILDRATNQIKLNNILNNIDISLKIELSIFEFTLIYCLNNNLNDIFIKSVYDDKLNNIISNIIDTQNINNKIIVNLKPKSNNK